MDWAGAIERNGRALREIAAMLFALLGTAGGARRISRPLHRALLRVLHPAEAAVRRLIVMAARGLTVKLQPARPWPGVPAGRKAHGRLSFPLFDPRKSLGFARPAWGPRPVPRIHVFGYDPRIAGPWRAPELPAGPASKPDDGLVDARRVTLRLEALGLALADVPRQARRLARLLARRKTDPALQCRSPLRPGPPPGRRKARTHAVDAVLAECHGLARDALAVDTS